MKKISNCAEFPTLPQNLANFGPQMT